MYSLLVSKFGVEQANTIFDAANIELKKVTMEYPDIPKGERRHTNLFIFPRVAIYRVMKQHFGKDAIELMDEDICFEGETMGGTQTDHFLSIYGEIISSPVFCYG